MGNSRVLTRSNLIGKAPEHNPETTGQTLSLLLQQVWLRVANETRFPQEVALLTARVELSCKPASGKVAKPIKNFCDQGPVRL